MSKFPSDDGVYVFDKQTLSWQRVQIDGPWVPRDDGLYAVYFRNRRCPGCKAFDKVWHRFVMERVPRLNVGAALVQCNSFFYDCNDKCASDTFLLFLVNASPQVLVLIVEEGELVYVERHIGFADLDDLTSFVLDAPKRREELLKTQQEVKESGVEELTVEGSDWKEIVEKLRKLILEGRNVREICDEEGCRYVIE